MGDLDVRVDRLESIEAIRDITARYPILLDARDLDGLVQLFIEDVKASPTSERGRGPLRAHYERLCRGWGYTVHQLYQLAIDFETPDKAMGHAYCKAEHEIDGKFVVAMLRYLDRYERRDGHWYFRWRQTPMWYVTEVRDGPVGEPRISWPNQPAVPAQLPDAFESYRRFYDLPTG
ncbi:MAG: nuclear transport factor 2 family protein [Acidobacteria bacterium]|nr:nuclear transport factor 2 family protein [Acidobacteriota bacterium]